MVKQGIFLIQDDGRLVEMTEQPYDSEDLLQKLLADYPSLLAGDQIDSSRPRRWLLIRREAPVPAEEGGGGRWSVDHVFLDQDAIPTLVEVKRSKDTRLRREVVGQMLDYAANAVVYWPVEKIQADFETNVATHGRDPNVVLQEFIGPDIEMEDFWKAAKTNLQAGKVRMIFVSDEVPAELKRVVEFLNTQMDPAEVLAVEIKQFAGHGVKSLIPKVHGQTSEAQRKKGGGPREERQWDEVSFFAALESRPHEEARVSHAILDWAKRRKLRIWWGKGVKDGSFYPMLDYHGSTHFTIAVRTGTKTAYVQMQFAMMVSPFDDLAKRHDFRERLNSIKGVNISVDAIDKYPSFYLATLADEPSLKHFLDTLDWLVEECKSANT